MSRVTPVREGTIDFRGFNVWYRIVGEDEPGLPLLCLHGGPGATHDYLEPIEALAGSGRRVVFYDQLGSGNSDHPHDPALWTVDLFLEEIDYVRIALGLSRIHLLGHSWGGMLAMEYALRKPGGLTSLIVANSTASIPAWIEETARLRTGLPRSVQQTLVAHEEAGTTDAAGYHEAVMEFYRRHLCRIDPFPECVTRTFEKLAEWPEVYHTMNGPSEFHVVGTLKTWTIADRLGEIRVPTLVIGGRYDEATPAITEAIHRGIPGSRWVIFEHSAHMPHVEEPELFRQVVSRFLSDIEASAKPSELRQPF